MSDTFVKNDPLTLKELIGVIWRRRFISLPVFVVVTVLALFAAGGITPMYEAKAGLAVDRPHQPVAFQADEFGTIDFSLLNTQRELLLSRPVLEQAYANSDLREGPAYRESKDPVGRLRDRLIVTTNRDSWVIAATFRDEDAGRAERGLRSLTDAFLDRQAERQAGRSQGGVAFLRQQVALGRDRLEQARRQEQDFRRDNDIQSVDPDRNHLALRLNDLNQAQIDVHRQRTLSQALLTQAREAESAADAGARRQALLRIDAINRNPLVTEQQQQLYALQGQEAQLSQKYLDKHPRMLEIRRQIAVKNEQLADAIALARASLDGGQSSLEQQDRDLNERIAATETELARYRANLSGLQALTDELESRQKLFDQLLTRLGEEEVSSRLDIQNVAVIDPATASARPVNIRWSAFLAVAVTLGAVAAALAAVAGESFDRRINGADSVRALSGLPLLGSLPHVPDLAALGPGGDPEKPFDLAEAYRALRATLHFARRRDGCQCLAVTSTSPGEGKSTVATRLAISLAATGSRVLLIDADMRHPTLQHQLGEPSERGLSLLLAGYTGITPTASRYANLDFLGVGIRPPNPAELLHSPALQYLLENGRDTYAFVIIDTPPLSLVSDALVISDWADGVLVVARDRVTVKSALRQTLLRLAPIADKVIGLVLNAEATAKSRYNYYYSYRYALGKDAASVQAS